MGMGKTMQAIALVLAKRALCREHDVFNLMSRVGNPGYRLPKAMSTFNATLSTQISKKMEGVFLQMKWEWGRLCKLLLLYLLNGHFAVNMMCSISCHGWETPVIGCPKLCLLSMQLYQHKSPRKWR
ncbi:hypothetical protein L1987_32419 [Smallanthus sonchifolius]|uniref:Uncharacterized protein n=1 Tax=Smallanthus sonchifolius TaxID=185202 RepID=A0ACB9HNU8_9ASTR|nr:hypothetical protein L1987_32419 [Smallanthus sonchifolius]